ncbi:MAG TPA: hypothetical protein VG253_24220 [Streptosporangiaceae bacterium]|nr:hypothetical protein [Streptosporangiaceae bacterium]
MVVSRKRTRKSRRHGLLCLAGAAAALGVAACGTQTATNSGSTSPEVKAASSPPAAGLPANSVCSDISGVSKLVVTRVATLPGNKFHFAFPAAVTVSNSKKVQAVATAVCAFPKIPSGARSCPIDLGLVYRLQFAAGTKGFPPISVKATGCMEVTGLGPIRWVHSAKFWTELAKALGVRNPTSMSLRGSVPRGGVTKP